MVSAQVHRTKKRGLSWAVLWLTFSCGSCSYAPVAKAQQMASFYTQCRQWNVNVPPPHTDNTKAVCLIYAVQAEWPWKERELPARLENWHVSW